MHFQWKHTFITFWSAPTWKHNFMLLHSVKAIIAWLRPVVQLNGQCMGNMDIVTIIQVVQTMMIIISGLLLHNGPWKFQQCCAVLVVQLQFSVEFHFDFSFQPRALRINQRGKSPSSSSLSHAFLRWMVSHNFIIQRETTQFSGFLELKSFDKYPAN
jgi:hypothetical protein